MKGNKFHSSVPRIDIAKHLPPEIDPAIDDVVKAFIQNEARIWGAIAILHIAAIGGARYGQAYSKALFARFGRPFRLTTDPHDQAVFDVLNQIYVHGAKLPGEFEPNILQVTGIDPDMIFDKSSLLFFDEMGALAIFESQLVNAWTMFETIAADLWTKTVNAFPVPLAALSGREKRIAGKPAKHKKENVADEEKHGSDDRDDESEGGIGHSLKHPSIGKIHKVTLGSFDLSKKMGTLWVASERVKFISLKGIREAYGLAFSEKYKFNPPFEIDKSLADKKLDALSLVRNLIVHNAGICDEYYYRDSKKVPTAPRLEMGERFKTEVEAARNLIDPVIMCSCQLITAVNTWIKNQNQKKRGEKKSG